MKPIPFLLTVGVGIFLILNCVDLIEPLFNRERLIAYYPFNGTANDISGNNNHGVLYGAVFTEDRFGRINRAVYFDGIDDYIDIGNQECLKTELPVTVAAWIKLEDGAYYPPIFLNNYTENHYFGIIFCLTLNNQLCINIGNGGFSGPQSRKSQIGNTSLQFNIWYHVAAVVKSAESMELFINGKKEEGLYSGSGGELIYNSDSGVIGILDASINNGILHFKGKIDDVRFYNRVLTNHEIYKLFKYL